MCIHVPSPPPASYPKSNHYPKFVVYHCMLSRVLLHTNHFASFENLFTSVETNRCNRKTKWKQLKQDTYLFFYHIQESWKWASTVDKLVPRNLSSSSWLPFSASSYNLKLAARVFQPLWSPCWLEEGEKEEGPKKKRGWVISSWTNSFKRSWKFCSSFILTAHWSELNHMTSSSCKVPFILGSNLPSNVGVLLLKGKQEWLKQLSLQRFMIYVC